mmetsp:Transcript_20945/g.49972  ORF Transcript_20945/g.49972 Transcript_20945/m.49972 type:complete len:419 (+) Transcript_20945:387-1643(+)
MELHKRGEELLQLEKEAMPTHLGEVALLRVGEPRRDRAEAGGDMLGRRLRLGFLPPAVHALEVLQAPPMPLLPVSAPAHALQQAAEVAALLRADADEPLHRRREAHQGLQPDLLAGRLEAAGLREGFEDRLDHALRAVPQRVEHLRRVSGGDGQHQLLVKPLLEVAQQCPVEPNHLAYCVAHGRELRRREPPPEPRPPQVRSREEHGPSADRPRVDLRGVVLGEGLAPRKAGEHLVDHLVLPVLHLVHVLDRVQRQLPGARKLPLGNAHEAAVNAPATGRALDRVRAARRSRLGRDCRGEGVHVVLVELQLEAFVGAEHVPSGGHEAVLPHVLLQPEESLDCRPQLLDRIRGARLGPNEKREQDHQKAACEDAYCPRECDPDDVSRGDCLGANGDHDKCEDKQLHGVVLVQDVSSPNA